MFSEYSFLYRVGLLNELYNISRVIGQHSHGCARNELTVLLRIRSRRFKYRQISKMWANSCSIQTVGGCLLCKEASHSWSRQKLNWCCFLTFSLSLGLKRGSPGLHRTKKSFQSESFDHIRTPKWMVELWLYQDGRLVVIIVVIKVTFSIIGLNNSSNTSIQGEMSFGIGSEYQKMRGIRAPANILLMTRAKKEVWWTTFWIALLCVCVCMCLPCTPQPAWRHQIPPLERLCF